MVLAAGAFAIHAYTLLSVQVHENHFYLALPLIAVAGAVLPRMLDRMSSRAQSVC